jgi:hypothetical protein
MERIVVSGLCSVFFPFFHIFTMHIFAMGTIPAYLASVPHLGRSVNMLIIKGISSMYYCNNNSLLSRQWYGVVTFNSSTLFVPPLFPNTVFFSLFVKRDWIG